MLALLTAVVAFLAPPPLALPRPTGPFPTGTTVAYLADSARRDAEFPAGRPVTVQLWYPAARSNHRAAPYLIERGLSAALLHDGYYGQDTATIRAFDSVRTHSRLDAPVARGRHPVLTFSVGMGVIRANYTSIAEELASHGWIVALVESPLLGRMMLPDGHLVADTVGRFETPSEHAAGVDAWTRDVSFALDWLQSGRRPSVSRRVASHADWSRVGAAGHSSGGVVALATCERDARVRACVDLDGGLSSPDGQPMASFVTAGITKPAMIMRSEPLYSDADFARRGLTRAAWEERGKQANLAFDSLARRSAAPVSLVRIAGTGHMSFSDSPVVMPNTISRFGGTIIDAERGRVAITTVLRAFLDQELAGKAGSLKTVAARFPEISVN